MLKRSTLLLGFSIFCGLAFAQPPPGGPIRERMAERIGEQERGDQPPHPEEGIGQRPAYRGFGPPEGGQFSGGFDSPRGRMLPPEEMERRKEEIRAAFEMEETEYGMELLDVLLRDLDPQGGGRPPQPGEGFSGEQGFPPPPPGGPEEGAREMAPDGQDLPQELRQPLREIAGQRAELKRFLTRYNMENRRLETLRNKMKEGQINSESLTPENITAKETELQERKKDFLKKVRERQPKVLEAAKSVNAQLQLLSPEEYPHAAEMSERLTAFEEVLGTLPASDEELFERLSAFNQKSASQMEEVSRPRTFEGTDPRSGDVEREIQLLKNRLDYLQREKDILNGTTSERKLQPTGDKTGRKQRIKDAHKEGIIKEESKKQAPKTGGDQPIKELPAIGD